MSYVARDIFQTKIDCTCGAEITIAQYREHLIRRHCNLEGSFERALRTVSVASVTRSSGSSAYR